DIFGGRHILAPPLSLAELRRNGRGLQRWALNCSSATMRLSPGYRDAVSTTSVQLANNSRRLNLPLRALHSDPEGWTNTSGSVGIGMAIQALDAAGGSRPIKRSTLLGVGQER